METLDIHHSRERVEHVRAAIQRRFSAENSKMASDFLDRLRLENKSWGRIENYGSSVIRILTAKDDKKISEWTKKDIESIHITIANASWENSTKKDTLTALKRLYHYTVHDEIADKSKGRDYDPTVEWITPGSFRDKYDKIQPKDLLTESEIMRMIQAVKKIGGRYIKRNIALVLTLFEGAYRPGELLNIKIGGLEFEGDFVRVHTRGKTGPKSITLVPSFVLIKEWLAEHPDGDNHEAYLWYHNNKDGVMTYQMLFYLIKRSVTIAGIKKRVWNYLFRHSALTKYSIMFGNIAKVYGNWSSGSNMLARYEHLASSDQEHAILKLHGLKKEDGSQSILFSKICPFCKERNSADKSQCVKCGKILSKDLVQKRKSRLQYDKKRTKQYTKEMSELRKDYDELKGMLVKILKERSSS